MRFFWENLADDADITPVSQNAYFPVANTQDYDREKVYKCTGANATERIVYDMGEAVTITDFICLHDFDGTETNIKIQGNATNSWDTPSVDEAITYSADVMSKSFTGGSYRYWRFVFTKASATDIRSIGRIFLGEALEPRDVDVSGLGMGWKDHAKVFESDGMKRFAGERGIRRSWRLPWGNLLESSGAADFREMIEWVGVHKPFFFQIDETSPLDEICYVYLEKDSYEQTMQGYAYGSHNEYFWNTSLDLVEAV